MSPGDGDESEKLLKNADLALSRAKNDSRGTFSFFEAGWTRAPRRRKIETELREAVQADTLRPYYQPLVDLSSGRITGFEALVRWLHPERGMISPAGFIPVAEDTGLIYASENGCCAPPARQIPRNGRTTGYALQVAVNVSARQFQQYVYLAVAGDGDHELKQARLPSKNLDLELTESAGHENDASRLRS